MTRAIYMDYAASTPVDPRVAQSMAQCLTDTGEFGNPASSHGYGEAANSRVESARAQVAACVGAAAQDVIWTSGATEANNLAIFGITDHYRTRGRHIITARTEHKAVLDPYRELERRGWQATYLTPDRSGIIDPQQVQAALREDTVLVSLMHVNNETGVVQDIAALAALCGRHGAACLHVDAAQSVGKIAVDFAGWGVDLMSLSAHKVYGPKGVGALLIARASRAARAQLTALQFGGGQERGLRAGTVPTHQVVGMGAAFELARGMRAAEHDRLRPLRERLWAGLAALGGIHRNGGELSTVPHLLNVSFEGVEGESLLALVGPELAVSTGAACSSASQEPSYVLRALGRDEVLSESSLRFALGRATSEIEIDAAIAIVTRAVLRLRRVSGS